MKKLLCIVMVVLLAIPLAAYTESSGQLAQTSADETVEERLYRMIPVFDSLARNMIAEGEAVYDAGSPEFFWMQLYLCAANWGYENTLVKQEGGRLAVPGAVIKEYAEASFYESEGLPDIPQSVSAISFDANSDTYRLNMSDAAQTYIVVERYALDADGVLLAGIGLYQSVNAQRAGGLLIQMMDRSYQGTLADQAFPYGVINALAESEEDFEGLSVADCQIQYVRDVVQPTASVPPAATPTPAPSEYPRLAVGSRGEDVKDLQRRLNELGYRSGAIDGTFGSATKLAVRYFQDAIGENQDGVATHAMQQRLYANNAPEFVTYVTLQRGSAGVRVEKLQARLRDLGYLAEPVDGNFGSRTKDAVMLFQKKAKLKSDGIAGERTLKALYKKNAPKCDVYISLKKGDTGPRVKEMQDRLRKLNFLSKKATGIYDNNTVKAVQAFMKAIGQEGNGKTADKNLLKKLFEYVPPTPKPTPTATPAPTATPTPAPTPAKEITNEQLSAFATELNGILGTEYNSVDAVKWLQEKLGVTQNGIYDIDTKDAVKAYQTSHGLDATGIADADIINSLF